MVFFDAMSSAALMQIRTGQGKSIILGACSMLLALLGFSVSSVCYSEYLSDTAFCFFLQAYRFSLHIF